ncbi:hypothetical protein BU24DRAFT_234611 [Aaosphaeria arxii CBS 175.79]|uniref:Uncharacterized protein n=1 Tax=Aaosphaeria arxii CBS 175.79 TaxID=1450172 RepID=A0A6A5XKA5_9PLEO|nr:uncharacterized protein BU24DRAFT_234611 [Aaosphaeria arxii CBS 175.79]KAF2013309.1 hypothetical protein BU24DRAFT_234611 [Aaosphaeria arxii CBS 175.79]
MNGWGSGILTAQPSKHNVNWLCGGRKQKRSFLYTYAHQSRLTIQQPGTPWPTTAIIAAHFVTRLAACRLSPLVLSLANQAHRFRTNCQVTTIRFTCTLYVLLPQQATYIQLSKKPSLSVKRTLYGLLLMLFTEVLRVHDSTCRKMNMCLLTLSQIRYGLLCTSRCFLRSPMPIAQDRRELALWLSSCSCSKRNVDGDQTLDHCLKAPHYAQSFPLRARAALRDLLSQELG